METDEEQIPEQNGPIFPGWARVLLIIIPFFIVPGLLVIPAVLLTGADLFDDSGWTLVTRFWSQLSLLAGTVLLVWFFRRFIDKKSFLSLGFELKNRSKDIAGGILLGILLMALGFAVLLWLGMIRVAGVQFVAFDFFLNLGLFVCVAFTEELFMRGYVLGNLMESMKKFPALILSSLFFALLHALNPDFGVLPCINLFLAGMLLGISYIYTKNLWFPIALHFSWNFFQGPVFGFNVSGTASPSIITQIQESSNLFNGGDFGFEGSLLCTGLSLVAIFIVWKFYRTDYSSKSKSKSKSSTNVGVPN